MPKQLKTKFKGANMEKEVRGKGSKKNIYNKEKEVFKNHREKGVC